MPTSTLLPTLIAALRDETLAVAGTLREIALAPTGSNDNDLVPALPNLRLTPLVARVAFSVECLSRLQRALTVAGRGEAVRVARSHAALLAAPLPPIGEFAEERVRNLARRLLQVERRYGWLCDRLAAASASDHPADLRDMAGAV